MTASIKLHRRRLLFVPFAVLATVGLAHAEGLQFKVEPGQGFQKSRVQVDPGVRPDQPLLLEAEQIDYDHESSVVVASGNVEVMQGEAILIADQLIYEQTINRLTARGNVSLLEASGNVYFADEVELKNDMKTGVINQFKARLADNSLFVASRARRIDENNFELTKAVYSPCKICSDGTSAKSPMWQMSADKIRVDENEQQVTYKNAYFETYGIPVFYMPHFSHPTPNADNHSGILIPEYEHSTNLGSVMKVPVYIALAPDKDATITPIYTTLEGLVMAGEYRQKLDYGQYRLNGSITNPSDRDALGFRTTGKTLRGNIDATGYFDIDENYKWGFDVHRATDDTYLRRYNFSHDTLLTSNVFAEGYNFIGDNDRTYGAVRALAFQGLTADSDSKTTPTVMPLADLTYQSDPGIYNSRVTFDANTMVLYRDTGAKSRRASATMGWKLPYITDDGQVIEFISSIRGDVYSVEDVVFSSGERFEGTTGRLVPEATAIWRYPFMNQGETSSLLLEPIVSATVSPIGGNSEEIPNEDSLVPEFTDTNLFSPNRFAGYDRIESGPRVSYGLRGQAQFLSDKYIDWLFGQHYRLERDLAFPFSNESVSHFSDYVGKIGISAWPFNMAYRFRLDKDEFTPKRNEIDAGFNYYPVAFTASYLSLQNDPVLATKEQVAGTATVNLTRQWAWNTSANHDLQTDEFVSMNTGLTYTDECTMVSGIVGKDFTRDRDIEPTTTFLFRIAFKNLN